MHFLLLNCGGVFAQQASETMLYQQLNNASNDSLRVIAYNKLACFYYAENNFKKGDSVIEQQIMLAEEGRNPQLIAMSYFENPGFTNAGAGNNAVSKKRIDYIDRALDYAKTNGLVDYTALAYAALASVHANKGETEKALKYAHQAFSTSLNAGNDSINAVCSMQLGQVYLSTSDILLAYNSFTNAYDKAVSINNNRLQSKALHNISKLYKKLGKNEIAKEYLLRSLAMNRQQKDASGQAHDFLEIGKLSNAQVGAVYLKKAYVLADSLHEHSAKLEAQKLLFVFEMLNKTPAENIAYLEKEKDLEQYYQNSGPHFLDWIIGEIYLYGSQPDSALKYLKRSEASFNEGYDLSTRKNFFTELAETYKQLNDYSNAIVYYNKIISLSLQSSDLLSVKNYSGELKKLYADKGDFKMAYNYSQQYALYSDSLDLQNKEKDLVLLEIENENKNRIRLEELAKANELREHNLQYMGITIVVATAFVLLIILGMFKVSRFTIKVLGFFSFIFLFEFIILYLDVRIHHFTNGEPLKVWLIKIGIISILFPMHHYIEGKVIHYLLSRQLIHIKNRFNLKRWWKNRRNTPVIKTPAETKVFKTVDPSVK